MARNSYEWFKFRFRDWLESERVRRMTIAAQGLYIRALSLQAIYGSIPADVEELSIALQVKMSCMSDWKQVSPHFTAEVVDSEERLYNKDLRDDLTVKQKVSKARSKAATKQKQTPIICEANASTRARTRSYSKSLSKSNIKREDLETSFNLFWAAYPNRKDKAAALKSWIRISPDVELSAKIIDHVSKRAVADPQWTKDGGQFVPMGSTFLNNSRWMDEYQTTFTTPPRGVPSYSPTDKPGFIKYDESKVVLLTPEQQAAYQAELGDLDY